MASSGGASLLGSRSLGLLQLSAGLVVEVQLVAQGLCWLDLTSVSHGLCIPSKQGSIRDAV